MQIAGSPKPISQWDLNACHYLLSLGLTTTVVNTLTFVSVIMIVSLSFDRSPLRTTIEDYVFMGPFLEVRAFERHQYGFTCNGALSNTLFSSLKLPIKKYIYMSIPDLFQNESLFCKIPMIY